MRDTVLITPKLPYYWPHRVQIHDTDCYGVVWHGAYLRWLEAARCDVLQQNGITVGGPDSTLWVFPVVEQHTRFKASPKAGDDVMVETHVTQRLVKLVFTQCVYSTGANRTLLTETTTHCVTIDANTKAVLRKMPPAIIACYTH
jgi:acyl-CoA thioester hydrolase